MPGGGGPKRDLWQHRHLEGRDVAAAQELPWMTKRVPRQDVEVRRVQDRELLNMRSVAPGEMPSDDAARKALTCQG